MHADLRKTSSGLILGLQDGVMHKSKSLLVVLCAHLKIDDIAIYGNQIHRHQYGTARRAWERDLSTLHCMYSVTTFETIEEASRIHIDVRISWVDESCRQAVILLHANHPIRHRSSIV